MELVGTSTVSLLTSTDERKRLLGLVAVLRDTANGTSNAAALMPLVVARYLSPPVLEKKGHLVGRRLAYFILRATPVTGSLWAAAANAIDRDLQHAMTAGPTNPTAGEVGVIAVRTVASMPFGHLQEYVRGRWETLVACLDIAQNQSLRAAVMECIIAYATPPTGLTADEQWTIARTSVLQRPRFAEVLKRALNDPDDVVCVHAHSLFATIALAPLPNVVAPPPSAALVILPVPLQVLHEIGMTAAHVAEVLERCVRLSQDAQAAVLNNALALCLGAMFLSGGGAPAGEASTGFGGAVGASRSVVSLSSSNRSANAADSLSSPSSASPTRANDGAGGGSAALGPGDTLVLSLIEKIVCPLLHGQSKLHLLHAGAVALLNVVRARHWLLLTLFPSLTLCTERITSIVGALAAQVLRGCIFEGISAAPASAGDGDSQVPLALGAAQLDGVLACLASLLQIASMENRIAALATVLEPIAAALEECVAAAAAAAAAAPASTRPSEDYLTERDAEDEDEDDDDDSELTIGDSLECVSRVYDFASAMITELIVASAASATVSVETARATASKSNGALLAARIVPLIARLETARLSILAALRRIHLVRSNATCLPLHSGWLPSPLPSLMRETASLVSTLVALNIEPHMELTLPGNATLLDSTAVAHALFVANLVLGAVLMPLMTFSAQSAVASLQGNRPAEKCSFAMREAALAGPAALPVLMLCDGSSRGALRSIISAAIKALSVCVATARSVAGAATATAAAEVASLCCHELDDTLLTFATACEVPVLAHVLTRLAPAGGDGGGAQAQLAACFLPILTLFSDTAKQLTSYIAGVKQQHPPRVHKLPSQFLLSSAKLVSAHVLLAGITGHAAFAPGAATTDVVQQLNWALDSQGGESDGGGVGTSGWFAAMAGASVFFNRDVAAQLLGGSKDRSPSAAHSALQHSLEKVILDAAAVLSTAAWIGDAATALLPDAGSSSEEGTSAPLALELQTFVFSILELFEAFVQHQQPSEESNDFWQRWLGGTLSAREWGVGLLQRTAEELLRFRVDPAAAAQGMDLRGAFAALLDTAEQPTRLVRKLRAWAEPHCLPSSLIVPRSPSASWAADGSGRRVAYSKVLTPLGGTSPIHVELHVALVSPLRNDRVGSASDGGDGASAVAYVEAAVIITNAATTATGGTGSAEPLALDQVDVAFTATPCWSARDAVAAAFGSAPDALNGFSSRLAAFADDLERELEVLGRLPQPDFVCEPRRSLFLSTSTIDAAAPSTTTNVGRYTGGRFSIAPLPPRGRVVATGLFRVSTALPRGGSGTSGGVAAAPGAPQRLWDLNELDRVAAVAALGRATPPRSGAALGALSGFVTHPAIGVAVTVSQSQVPAHGHHGLRAAVAWGGDERGLFGRGDNDDDDDGGGGDHAAAVGAVGEDCGEPANGCEGGQGALRGCVRGLATWFGAPALLSQSLVPVPHIFRAPFVLPTKARASAAGDPECCVVAEMHKALLHAGGGDVYRAKLRVPFAAGGGGLQRQSSRCLDGHFASSSSSLIHICRVEPPYARPRSAPAVYLTITLPEAAQRDGSESGGGCDGHQDPGASPFTATLWCTSIAWLLAISQQSEELAAVLEALAPGR